MIKYLSNGGCYKNCPKGSYQKDGKDYCKCMVNTTCESCTSLAIENNKCTTCNIEGGFYPKKEDINYQYMECYNDETIPDNYILIHENNQYESCYGFCATCESIGTSEKEQKCKTCISDYTDLNGDGNCYKNCEHYFYFNNEGKITYMNIMVNVIKLVQMVFMKKVKVIIKNMFVNVIKMMHVKIVQNQTVEIIYVLLVMTDIIQKKMSQKIMDYLIAIIVQLFLKIIF